MSKIEWTDATWNPVIGCRHVAEGCRHCYAETMSKRLAAMGQKDYASILTPEGKFNGKAITRPGTLSEPLRWKKPRLVFVNSMSDLFHEDVPFEFIAAVFGVMAACPQHTFQVLTKRPARALEFFDWFYEAEKPVLAGHEAMARAHDALGEYAAPFEPEVVDDDGNSRPPLDKAGYAICESVNWDEPLKNVWLGVSASTQKETEANAALLFKCPAALRFLSLEPLIERIDIGNAVHYCFNRGEPGGPALRIDWVIVGGESGPGARPCDVAWIREIVKYCKNGPVPVFVKQLGANSQEQFGGSGALRPRLKTANRKGGDPSEWPEDLRVREFPSKVNHE